MDLIALASDQTRRRNAPYLGRPRPPPAPREKRFGEDEFSEDVNSMLTTEELITELKQRKPRT